MPHKSSRDDANREEDEAKMKEYSTFIDETLHPELKKRVAAREEVEHEIADYQDLSTKLEALPLAKVEAMVDLGHQAVYCQAVATDSKLLYVHVGMGFHAEMTRPEAITFCEKRVSFLNTVLTQRVESATQVARHVKASLIILEQLANEMAEKS